MFNEDGSWLLIVSGNGSDKYTFVSPSGLALDLGTGLYPPPEVRRQPSKERGRSIIEPPPRPGRGNRADSSRGNGAVLTGEHKLDIHVYRTSPSIYFLSSYSHISKPS